MSTVKTYSDIKPILNASVNKQDVCVVHNATNEEKEYNKGIRIHFPKNKSETAIYPDFDFSTYNTGFVETIQNCLVNTLTRQGSDTVHPTKGTQLQDDAVQGFIYSTSSLAHSCNFAAETTKLFENDYLSQNYKEDTLSETTLTSDLQKSLISPTIMTYRLQPDTYQLDSVDLKVYFESSDGDVFGEQIATTLI